jgi:dTDP-4-amino-4,6-dideoxygalactose transaminase
MIPLFKVFLSNNVAEDLKPTLESGTITQGPMVDRFETKIQELFNYPYVVSLNSATSAITLALRMIKDELNLSDTTEVLTCPLTCMATNEPILANNMRIKWVDADVNTCNIDLSDLESKITENTRIILFVHWGGNPVNIDELNDIVRRNEVKYGHRICVIEDCAHAMLSEWNGHKLGTQHCHYAVYSLQAIKHLTTGDGGLLVLPSEERMETAKLLRWFGIDRNKRNFQGKDLRLENDVVQWGYKFHMNDISASIGLSNLPHIQDIVDKHVSNAEYYSTALANVAGVRIIQKERQSKPSYWIYTMLVERRDEFAEFMKNKNVMVSCVHKRNDINTCFADFTSVLPNLDSIEDKYVSIPVGWWVTNENREYIVCCIKEFYSSSQA